MTARHGTHVAGILAGDGGCPRGVFAGMAPWANLCVLESPGSERKRDIGKYFLEGDRLADVRSRKRYGIRMVNLSVGMPAPELNEEKRTCHRREWNGCGMRGWLWWCPREMTDRREGTVAVPGTSRKVITVGALGMPREVEGYSGRGSYSKNVWSKTGSVWPPGDPDYFLQWHITRASTVGPM